MWLRRRRRPQKRNPRTAYQPTLSVLSVQEVFCALAHARAVETVMMMSRMKGAAAVSRPRASPRTVLAHMCR